MLCISNAKLSWHNLKIWNKMQLLHKITSKKSSLIYYTGGPSYSRWLRSQKVPRVPKPRITREHCMGKKSCFLRQNGQKSADNKGKFCGYQVLGIKNNPRIVKTANSKPANSEGRLYYPIILILFTFYFKCNHLKIKVNDLIIKKHLCFLGA